MNNTKIKSVNFTSFLSTIAIALLLLSPTILTQQTDINPEKEKLHDPAGYHALVQLHSEMDDDKSGSIDRMESTDFLKEDMNIGGNERTAREKMFHQNNDELITVDDLWRSWLQSNERRWTTQELAHWLEVAVRLPQYSQFIVLNEVDGRALPRMAVMNSSTFLSNILHVKSASHKRRIRLKALDVVLFGHLTEISSKLKDIALSVLLGMLIIVLIIFKRQRQRSKCEVQQLNSKLSQLKLMQSDLEEAPLRSDNERYARRQRNSSGFSPSDTFMCRSGQRTESIKSQLFETERLLINANNTAPLALQPLLRNTYKLEMNFITNQRKDCINEMREAIEDIDKLRKKQTSILSSIKLVTGASTGTDHIDSKIFSLKARMEMISLTMSESDQRWNEIESLCGFPLLFTSPSIAESTEQIHALYGNSLFRRKSLSTGNIQYGNGTGSTAAAAAPANSVSSVSATNTASSTASAGRIVDTYKFAIQALSSGSTISECSSKDDLNCNSGKLSLSSTSSASKQSKFRRLLLRSRKS